MTFEPTKSSIRKHKVPDWFHDAKFGIFIHWGLYSVPAFAAKGLSFSGTHHIDEENYFKNNPYAEWYLNSLRITGSPTQDYHYKEYGKDFSYDQFVPIFNEELKSWNPEEWVKLFKKAGAKYVVLVTKHHDGFVLWPSKYKNPMKDNYFTRRNIVSELTHSVKKMGLKMGFYYSTSLDWSFNPIPINSRVSDMTNGITTIEYTEYVKNHWYELIDEYKPSILWSDIGAPPFLDLLEIFAYYYNKFPDGVINDRWDKIFHENDEVYKIRRTFFYDFTTPEYYSYNIITRKKWESNRGIGNSYGYNKLETEDDYLSSAEIVRMLVDIVSKNGNLLLNVGPMPNGKIPDIQQKILRGVGQWLEINGEAIYGSRPWERAEGYANNNLELRFTQKNGKLYVHLLNNPKGNQVRVLSLNIPPHSIIRLLGYKEMLTWEQDQEDLIINLPTNISKSPVYVFKVNPI
jgi:alpha-L-fucosidase